MRLAFVATASALMLAGCTTSMINSAPVESSTTAEAFKENRPQLTYFLPESVVVATVKKQAPPAPDDPPAGATATATVTTNISIDGKKTVAENSEKSKEPSCDDQKAAYARLVGAHNDYITSYEKSLVAIEFALNGDLKTLGQQRRANAILLSARANRAEDNGHKREAGAIYKKAVEVCNVKLAVTLSTEVVPDRSKPYVLLLADDPWSSDKLSVKIDTKGLLTAISTTADDKSGEAIVEAAKTIGTIYGTVSPLNVASFQTPPNLNASSNFGLSVKSKFSFESQFKIDSEDGFRNYLSSALLDLKIAPPDPFPELPLTSLPDHPFQFSTRDIEKLKVEFPLEDSGFFLKADCDTPSKDMTRSATQTKTADGILKSAYSGAMMSSPRICEISIIQKESDIKSGRESIKKYWVNLMDSDRPMEVLLPRTRLVSRPTSYAFKDGQLTDLNYEKPSTIAAGVALPGKIIGGLLSGLIAGVEGPGGVYSAQAKYLDAQASVYTSQAALIKAKSDADAAKAMKSGSTSSSSP